jgi:hypothetical protein
LVFRVQQVLHVCPNWRRLRQPSRRAPCWPCRTPVT